MRLPYPPPIAPPQAEPWLVRLVDTVRGVLGGKMNADGSFTVVENADSTDIIDPRIGFTSVILFMPLTASAAAELYGGAMYVSAQTTGQATVAHANDPATDRDFRFVIIA